MKKFESFNNEKLSFLFIGVAMVLFFVSCEMAPQNKTTRNGYEVEYLKKGDGVTAKTGDHIMYKVKVEAEDSLIQSTFEEETPMDFPVPTSEELQSIDNPLVDALEMMSVGDELRLTQPIDSFEGQQTFGLEKGQNLYYTVAVEDIVSQERFDSLQKAANAEKEKAMEEYKEMEDQVSSQLSKDLEAFNSGALGDEVIDHDSGLKYIIHEEGDGEKPTVGEPISVHYYGVLRDDGTTFDNSYSRGQPIQFPVGRGQVIPGWDNGLMELRKGTKATLFIPFDQAYGASGRPPQIPEKADLVFYVHLLK